MSRIILSRYDDGQEHVVVGWDNPLQTYFWQEFNKEPADWDSPEAEEWEEMIGFAGYSPRELPEVQDLLNHAATHNDTVLDAMMKVNDDPLGKLVQELQRHKLLQYPDTNIEVNFAK